MATLSASARRRGRDGGRCRPRPRSSIMATLSASARRHFDAVVLVSASWRRRPTVGLGPASWRRCRHRPGVMVTRTLSAPALRHVAAVGFGPTSESWRRCREIEAGSRRRTALAREKIGGGEGRRASSCFTVTHDRATVSHHYTEVSSNTGTQRD